MDIAVQKCSDEVKQTHLFADLRNDDKNSAPQTSLPSIPLFRRTMLQSGALLTNPLSSTRKPTV